MVVWNRINTVLLDMDGTLLDLHFDNHFWHEHVPQRYAQKHGLALDAAKTEVGARYRRVRGTLDWYCVDYWTRELELDIRALKEETAHLIAIRPHVLDFLAAVRRGGKRLVLVTNAHGKALAIKLRCTQIGPHFDDIVCAHDLGLPKEDVNFWDQLQRVQPFAKNASILIDDNLDVLRSARTYGIEQLLAVKQPDSKRGDKDVAEFNAVGSFRDIMPT